MPVDTTDEARKAKARERGRKYRSANPEKIKGRNRKYHAENHAAKMFLISSTQP